MVEKKQSSLVATADPIVNYLKTNYTKFEVSWKTYDVSLENVMVMAEYVKSYGLDYRKGEVSFIPFYNSQAKWYKLMPIMWYDVPRKRALSKWLVGWCEYEYLQKTDGKFLWRKITLRRRWIERPFIDILTYDEAVPRDQDWTPRKSWPRGQNPSFMVKKTLTKRAYLALFWDVFDWNTEMEEQVIVEWETTPDVSESILDEAVKNL